MNLAIEVSDVCKNYRDFAVKNISFQLEKGLIMGFIGPNGAGKSTTIKLIMNMIRRDSGKISIFGMDNIADEVAVKNRIGFVFDENYFFEELTINQMKNVIAPFYRNWNDTTFNNYLKMFSLPANKKIKDLSRGMTTKFALALALSHQADLIIMDEPTSGLDPVFRDEILNILRELMMDDNKAILFSTHITTDLDKVADKITFINNGEIVFTGDKDTLMDNYGLVKGSKELLDDDTKKEFMGIKLNNYGFTALTKDAAKTRSLFHDSVIIERPTLEDIMLYTVRSGINV